jgi:hypothetical protein
MVKPIRIRGHTLLCLQGFRGEGYSPEFVENMAAIHRQLADDPTHPVLVVDVPDAICSSCPNLRDEECHLHGPGSEEGMIAQDQDVMHRLRIAWGEELPWKEILHRISQAVSGEMLPKICGRCPWLPLGYCKEGMDRLRDGVE